MEKQYIKIPNFTTINDIALKSYSLSATQYKSFCIKNENLKTVREFLDRDLERKDLGVEVGSEAYVDNSGMYFIKTKALQAENYLLDINKESFQQISPKSFIEMSLKKGDLLISKDSNVGEICILDKDYNNAMLCGAIYKLPVTKYKYYLLAFIKSELFRQQIDFLVPRGSTIRHGKTKFLECLIPIPNKNCEDTIRLVEILMQCIINKEVEIKKKHNEALSKIQKELEINQLDNTFHYELPTYAEILKTERLDSSLYSKEYKRNLFFISNYKHGTQSLEDLGFQINRGQNLQITCIGQSIYSDTYKEGFYTLVRPTNISQYGTVSKYEYLGNKNDLLSLKDGDVIFGAEGTFRSFVVLNKAKNMITNIHGVVLNQKSNDPTKSIFIKLCLDYYMKKGILKSLSVGGNGGSLAIQYLNDLIFPKFPTHIEKEITKLFHNEDIVFDYSRSNLDGLLEYDSALNEQAGIYELDASLKHLKEKLEEVLDRIANDQEIEIMNL